MPTKNESRVELTGGLLYINDISTEIKSASIIDDYDDFDFPIKMNLGEEVTFSAEMTIPFKLRMRIKWHDLKVAIWKMGWKIRLWRLTKNG